MKTSIALILFVGAILISALPDPDSPTVNKSYLKYDDGSWKPLHEVAQYGTEADIQELIKNGANVNLVNGEGLTALHVAARNGFDKTADLLIRNGANVNYPNIFGKTPLHVAASQGNLKIVDLLVKNGANANVVDADGLTALQYAINRGDDNVAANIRDSMTTTTPRASTVRPSTVRTSRARRISTTSEASTTTVSFLDRSWNQFKEKLSERLTTTTPDPLRGLKNELRNLFSNTSNTDSTADREIIETNQKESSAKHRHRSNRHKNRTTTEKSDTMTHTGHHSSRHLSNVLLLHQIPVPKE